MRNYDYRAAFEHPWGGDESSRITDGSASPVKGRLVALVLLVMVVMLSPALAQSQEKIDFNSDSLAFSILKSMNKESQAVADDYLDYLEQISVLLSDFEDVGASLSEDESTRINDAIGTVRTKIADGKYNEGFDDLIKDINSIIDVSKDIQSDHKVRHNTNTPRSTRLLRSMTRELIVMVDQIEDYSETYETMRIFDDSTFSVYVGESMQKYAELIQSQTEHVLKALEAAKRHAEATERVIVIPPTPPTPPDVSHSEHWDDFRHGSGASVATGRINTDRNLPVRIASTTGNVLIQGTSDDYIEAELAIDVKNVSNRIQQKYLSGAALKLTMEADAYQVDVVLPTISDLSTGSVSSLLTLHVPEELPIFCKNSFGGIAVSEMQSEINLEASFSNIQIDDCAGDLTVKSQMGSLSLDVFEGRVSLVSKNTPITLNEVDGKMEINSEAAPIQVRDSYGSIQIMNSGLVQISDVEANVIVKNPYGSVTVTDIVGDVEVSTAYEPLTVFSVDGKAKLVNQFAAIECREVSGPIEASNNTAQTFITEPGDAVIVDSRNGNVHLSLDDDLLARSSIKSAHGAVFLTLTDYADLVLRAKVCNGDLVSAIKLDGVREGRCVKVDHEFGDGGEILEVDCSDAELTVTVH